MELKRLLTKKMVGILLFLLMLMAYFVQIGIDQYKSTVDNKEIFLDFEAKKVEQYINYNQYGTYGFRIFFMPSPLSVFFSNSSSISELTSIVDAGERLNIYNSFKGKALFSEKLGGFKDFSGIMLLLGSLMFLYCGYEALIHKDYLRFTGNLVGFRRLFLSIIISRFFFLVIFFAGGVGIAFIQLKLNHITLSRSEYNLLGFYVLNTVLLSLFFLAIGTIAGSFKSRFSGFVLLIISWFLSVLLIPGLVSRLISQKADNITPEYTLELRKLKTLMEFEKRAFEKYGPTDTKNISEVRELIESYWRNELRKIQDLEKKLVMEVRKNIRRFQVFSIHFPTTFYLSVNNEISSKGYNSFNSYYDYIRRLKEKFVRFYLDRRYYTDTTPDSLTKIESFLKKNENVFIASSGLPGNFWGGCSVTLAYIFVLWIISYVRFKKNLFL